jgi:predicted nucleic acid-binding protein
MAATGKRIVIDASVALKWRFRDEVAADEARALLEDHARGALHLLAPPLFDYEITNAFRSAVLRARLTEEEAVAALSDLRTLAIERPDFHETQHLTLRLGCQYQRSAYDSAYLALALANRIWFFTGDLRLFNAVSAQLSWVKWIGEYRLDAIPETAT